MDGISKEKFGKEMEWMGHSGAKLEVVKVEEKRIYLKLIGQLK